MLYGFTYWQLLRLEGVKHLHSNAALLLTNQYQQASVHWLVLYTPILR